MAERRGRVIRIALILLGIGALYALFVHITGLAVPCPIRLVTGLECPGCGVSRMMMSIFRLDLRAAFHYNMAIFCLLPLMAATFARYVYVYIRYGRMKDKLADISVWFMIAVLLLFGVMRNIF